MAKSAPTSKEYVTKEWSIGAYPVLARTFLAAAARLVDAAGIGPQDHVLDVACGTGNVALTAHRRGATVTGVDIAPAMLEGAREQAAVIDAAVDWHEGDAGDLPFEDDAFDVTVSCFGHMFVHDAPAAGSELVRVTKPGGRIAFTSWTPESGIAAMMTVLSAYLPPEDDPAPPPALWGDPETVSERFGDRVDSLQFETGVVRYPALSPAHFWESMTTDSGGIILALEQVAEEELPALREREIEALAEYFSDADNAMALDYRIVMATVA